MFNIIVNEFRLLLRQRTFIYLILFFIFSLFLTVWVGNVQAEYQKQYQKNAENKNREQWEDLEPMNPHSAAHYGSYAFKPVSVLNSLDNGINDITGNVIKLEGHVQNEIVYSEASQSISISKFGKLKASLLLQYVLPLVIIFLSFSSVVNEKKYGRIKLLILQGVSIRDMIISKSITIWIFCVLLMFLTILIQVFTFYNLEILKRSFLLMLAYGFYYFIISFLVTYFSAIMKNRSSVLSSVLVVWIFWTFFMPKIWGNAVEKIHTLPSRKIFKEVMNEERSKGIDGHNPYDQRREKLKNKFLKEYNVDSLSQLPINFDGIVMQADEEYGNIVWDKHFGNNYSILKKQKFLYQLSGIINPFIALQNLSMGFCGTDMLHHLDFLQKAEDYRRYLIKTLNEKHAYGGSKTGDWKWKVDSNFFKSVDSFNYQTPKILNQINYYIVDIISLIMWIAFVFILIKTRIRNDII